VLDIVDENVQPVGEESHRTKGLLRLTMACNERCPFCNVPMEDYARPTPPMEQSLQELQQFLDEGADTLTISGGEPTLLKKRLLTLVKTAREGGIRFIELQTNAVLITPAYGQLLADAGVTSAFVSLLSHVPEHHDHLAGLDGAFAKCLAGIDALLDAGIRVTLNPVTARPTQELVPDYIDFVAERLPRVGFVSLSAVQPHGRAKEALAEMLPDYDVLRRTIPLARERAAHHGIDLVNPYCGLPLCVGWSDDPSRSVEAWEASRGGWMRTPGLNNQGNKRQGGPCLSCAVRTRCGGAWHAYWDRRGPRGLEAPVHLVTPWEPGGMDHTPTQRAYRLHRPARPSDLPLMERDGEPTVWLHATGLSKGMAAALLPSVVTDVALDVYSLDPAALRETLTEVKRLLALGRQLDPQLRIRVWIGVFLVSGMRPDAILRTLRVFHVLGVDAVRLISASPKAAKLAQALAPQLAGLDLQPLRPPVAVPPS